MSNIKIFVCAHKEAKLPEHPYFLPVQAGAALHPLIKGYQPDSEGDNISAKNPHFCELTCHYWAWKNLKGVDIVGLNHYRRFFDFQQPHPERSADKHFVYINDFFKQPYLIPDLDELMNDCDIILPVARHWRISNTRQYAKYHIARDWETLRQIIKERHPDYIPAFEKTMDHSNLAVGYNMFITHWKHFDAYSTWLFDILFEVERRVPPAEDPVQGRIYGYMSERLINVFCEHHHLRIKPIPLIMPLGLNDYQEVITENISSFHWRWRCFINDTAFRLCGK